LQGSRQPAAEGAIDHRSPVTIVTRGCTNMAYWLFKEEPDHYSFADLQRDKITLWDGVTNNLARKNLRQVKKGDQIFFYHTGKEKAVVGEMEAAGDANADPAGDDPKAVVVKVTAARQLPKPVTLARIKKDQLLADWALVRMSRLSVMPATAVQWRRVQELSREDDE
jgi:predicted RNA-binding protein with PUA-like domain